MAINTAKFDGKPVEVIRVEKAPKKTSMLNRIAPAFVALAFAGILSICMVAPASAEINLTFVGPLFTSLFNAITSIFPSFEAFIDAGFPLLIKIFVYMAILGVIGLGLYLFRGVIEKVINAIGISK
jgi:hypothetical protein